MSKPVQACLDIIKDAKQGVNKLLKGTEHTNNLLEINSLFQRLETKFTFMGAITEGGLNGESGDNKFPPITSFMGNPIDLSKRVTSADLNPQEAQKQKFRNDVQKLYNEIRNLTPDLVLKNYKIPEHLLIIRGVAKKAGLTDYNEREINIPFIEEIQLAIEEKEEAATAQQGIDKASGKTPTSSIVLTDEAIEADPVLQKMKAKPGDEAITAPDGIVSLKRKKN